MVAIIASPGAVLFIPGAVLFIPGAVLSSPGAVLFSPGAVLFSLGAVSNIPGAKMCPSAVLLNPGAVEVLVPCCGSSSASAVMTNWLMYISPGNWPLVLVFFPVKWLMKILLKSVDISF